MKISGLLLLSFITFFTLSCDDAQSLHKRASEYEAVENYQTAIEYLDRAIALDSLYIDAYLDRAVNKSYLENYAGAIDDYNQVIQIDSTIQLPYYNRAKNYNKIGKPDLALKDIKKCNSLTSLVRLGTIYDPFSGDIIESKLEKYYVEVDEMRLEVGIAYMLLDSVDLAIKYLEVAEPYFLDIDELLEPLYKKKEIV